MEFLVREFTSIDQRRTPVKGYALPASMLEPRANLIATGGQQNASMLDDLRLLPPATSDLDPLKQERAQRCGS